MNELRICIDFFAYKDDIIFNNIEYTANRGEITAIIGANGTGKSTLVKIFSGMIKSKSQMFIDNKEVKIGYNDKVLYIPYDFCGLEYLTLKECIMYYSILNKLKFDENKIKGYLKLLLISEKMYSKTIIKNLSKGTKQKAVFIVYMILNYDIIVFDEGLENIDNECLNIIMNELEKWVSDNKICLIATHSNDILKYADAKWNLNE